MGCGLGLVICLIYSSISAICAQLKLYGGTQYIDR